jgi:4-hydroxybenzoate polyprenyltransferase
MATSSLSDWVALFRPKQCVKNAFVLAPLLFGGRATDPGAVMASLGAAGLFSLLASGMYAVNDAYDADKDRAHPRKRTRPIAARRISSRAGTAVGVGMSAMAVCGAWLLDPRFGIIGLIYVLVNLAYTLVLAEVVLIDVFTVASFFLMRLLAGAAVVDVMPSIWLLLCGGLLALHLAVAKRRHELAFLGDDSARHRAVLAKYGIQFLDQASSVLLSVTVVSYMMYTLSSETAERAGGDVLAYSVVFVLFGVFRYLYLSHHESGGGDPAETLLTDRHLQATVLLWSLYCGWVVYFS